MLVQRIQTNYYSPNVCRNQSVFGRKGAKLKIENKNPLVNPEVRRLAGEINEFFNSIEGKAHEACGLRIGDPVSKSYTCSQIIDKEQVTLYISKNPPSKQVTCISFTIPQGEEVTKTIEYQPSAQRNGQRTDDLVSYYSRRVFLEGRNDYDYNKTSYDEMNDKFILYAKQFVEKFNEVKNTYTKKGVTKPIEW